MADRVGQQLGNYRLVALLGQGGYAKVYLGQHLRLDIQVAIKVLHTHLTDSEAEHFQQEAKTIARLAHPSIVRVFDFDVQNGVPYLVMDYAPNGSLRRRYPKGSVIPLPQIISSIKQVAAALQYAHEQKFIHRDVKPENLLLGRQQEVLLGDFGLVALAHNTASLSAQGTVGTIAYMAPEQIEGYPRAASDQYALGVVVYEWLCGERPFAGSLTEVMFKHLNTPPPPLRERVQTIPLEVEQVVLRALAKGPKQRFDMVADFATALQQAASAKGSVPAQQVKTTPTPTRSSQYIGRSQQSPLIGREQQLGILRQMLYETEQQTRTPPGDQKTALTLSFDTLSRAPCIMLLGEMGIGKTRLAEEVSREAQQRGWTVLWSRAHAQEHTMPYQLWIQVLRNAMSQGQRLQSEVSQHPELYQPLVTLLPEFTDLLPQKAVSSAVLPEQVQLRLREAILWLLTTACERAPLLIVLDDLHWADFSSCELLGYLIRRFSEHQLLLMGTCRESELPPTHPLRILLANLQRERAVTTLHIQRLNDAQIGTLVGHLPGPPPQSIMQYIQNQAVGNPFFAEELARSVGAQSIAPDRAYTLPDRISAVLDLRMGRISTDCQNLLLRAAVLGGSFEFNSICSMEVGPGADEDTTLDLLEEALQAGMLTEEGSGTRITYYFWHPLLVNHLYHSLSAARRASLHRRAAEVLRKTYQGQEEEGAAVITYHLVKGGADSPQIAHYAEMAGDRAYALSAYPEAVQHYRLAVEHKGTPPMDARSEEWLHLANLLERLGESTRVQGNEQEARRYFEQALEIHSLCRFLFSDLSHQYEAQIEALLWCEIGKTWFDTGDNAHALQCYSHGEQVLRETQISTGPAWASLHLERSYVLWREGNFEEASQAAHSALNIFEDVHRQQYQVIANAYHSTATSRTLEGDPVDLGRAHRLLASIAVYTGQSSIALDHLNTALAIFEQCDRQREIALVCGDLGDAYLRQAEHTLAQAALRRSLSIAERIGHVSIMSVAYANLGVLSARFGDLAEAEAWYKRGLTLTEQVNDPVYMSLWYGCLASIMQDQGKINEAKLSVCQAITIGRTMNITPCIGFALVALGHLHIAQALASHENTSSSPDMTKRRNSSSYTLLLKRASICLRRALTIEGLEAETKTDGQLALAQVSLLLGEIDTAHQQAIQAMEESRRYDQIWLLACAQRLLGDILSTQNQHEQAETYFVQALEIFNKSGMRLEWARTLQSYGVALLEQQNAGDSSYEQGLKYLQDARLAFHDCNAILDLQVIEGFLARHTSPIFTSTQKSTGQKGEFDNIKGH